MDGDAPSRVLGTRRSHSRPPPRRPNVLDPPRHARVSHAGIWHRLWHAHGRGAPPERGRSSHSRSRPTRHRAAQRLGTCARRRRRRTSVARREFVARAVDARWGALRRRSHPRGRRRCGKLEAARHHRSLRTVMASLLARKREPSRCNPKSPQITLSLRPTFLKARTATSRSSLEWAGETWHRTRACPCGTTGKPNPCTKTPPSRSASLI